MGSRYRINEPDKAHFVTATIVEWLPVFTTAACCDILVESLEYCRREKGLKIFAWVIMDNHFHALLFAPDLSDILRDLKSFTAMRIIEQLQTERRDWLLNQLHHYCAAHKVSQYQLWQEGSHPQAIFSDDVMRQKMDYMHNNPIQRGWVASPEHWRYSSGHERLDGVSPVLECDEWA